MKNLLLLLTTCFLFSLSAQTEPNRYWYVCYKWPDGSVQCGSKRSGVDPCSLCPCYAPDEDGNNVRIACSSSEVTGISLEDPDNGFALDYDGNTVHCTDSNTLTIDYNGVDVELCSFDSFIDTYGDSSVLAFFLTSDSDGTINLSIKEDYTNQNSFNKAAPEFNWSASRAEIHKTCFFAAPESYTEFNDSLSDKILFAKQDFFKVYPNPATDHLKIQWPEKVNKWKQGTFTFVLYDMAGTEVKRLTISQEITEFNIETLSQELYCYKIFLDNSGKSEYCSGLITVLRE